MIKVTAKAKEVKPNEIDYVTRKVAAACKVLGDHERVNPTITISKTDNPSVAAEYAVAINGRSLNKGVSIKEKGSTLEEAADLAADKFERALRKTKEKNSIGKRRVSQKASEAYKATAIAAMENTPDDAA